MHHSRASANSSAPCSAMLKMGSQSSGWSCSSWLRWRRCRSAITTVFLRWRLVAKGVASSGPAGSPPQISVSHSAVGMSRSAAGPMAKAVR